MDEDCTDEEMFQLLEAGYYMDSLEEEMCASSDEACLQSIDVLNNGLETADSTIQTGGAGALDPTNYFELYDQHVVNSSHLRTSVYASKIKFKDLDTIPIAHLPRALLKIMDSVVEASSDGARHSDYIRFYMNSDALTDPVNMPYMMRSELTGERLLHYITRIQNSNAEFNLEGPGFNLTVYVTKFPSPGGQPRKGCRKRVTVDLLKWMTANKKCAIAINADDNLCLARALVVAKAHLEHEHSENDKKQFKALRDGRRTLQLKAALELHRKAIVPLGVCGLLEADKFQRVFSELDISIIIIDASTNFNVVYRGPIHHKKCVYLLLANEHFTPITNISAFYGCENYCVLCMKPTSRKHNCTPHCSACFSANCGEFTKKASRNIRCDKCNRYFYGASCLQSHIQNNTCDKVKACPTCYRLEKNHKECFTHQCEYCKKNVQSSHQCYIQTVDINENTTKKNKRDPTYWYYDFETARRDDGTHVANLVVVQRGCDGQQYIFQGSNARDLFCEWVFNVVAVRSKSLQIFIAHYAKGYDSHLVMEYVYKRYLYPEVIWTGHKIMCVDVGNVRFIDSFNFLPMPLAALPATFNLVELKKGYFPHLFNTPENQSYVGPLPDLRYYEPDLKRARERASLIAWHSEQSAQSLIFDLQRELLDYCISDVEILRRACETFRQLGLSLFQCDPFNGCITIAAYCLKVYRGLYMPTDSIGIIPAGGYRGGGQRHSNMAVKWIMWSAQQSGVHIQHARNGGEVTIGKYKVDGFDVGNRVIYKFYGCFFHGCDRCYRDNVYNPVSHCAMYVLRHRTLQRHAKLEDAGFTVKTMWECKFKELLQADGQMKEFVESVNLEEALEPKDAFFGGRTAPMTLYYKIKNNEIIRYCDYVSLYPTVNKYDRMPVEEILIGVNEPYVIAKYFGVIKCNIIPPRQLYHPVLPYRSKGKLLFPLCHTCADMRLNATCEHDDQLRGWMGTWTTVEVDLAVENGYAVSKVYEIWHYPQTIQFKAGEERGMFSEYVNTLLRLKQEASGYPSWVKTREDEIKFSSDYLQEEGIALGQVEKNTGKRALAKIMLNSLWGKFAQREDLPKTAYIDNFNDFRNLLTDEKKVVTDVYMINEKMLMVTYVEAAEMIAPSGRTSVVIAAFTTACARIRLYHLLRRLGESVLYMDTDSVIFVSDNDVNPLSDMMGERLGQLTDEVEGEYGPEVFIKEFVSGGPKNYGYLLSNGVAKWKVKGITVNHITESVINYDVIRAMVAEPTTVPERVSVPVSQVKRNKATCTLKSVCGDKMYRVVFDKGVVNDNFKVYPYGYVH